MWNIFIWPIHRTLSGAIIPWQSGSGSNGNEGILGIHPQILTIRLFSVISGHLLGESHPSTEMQSVYCAATADWAIIGRVSPLTEMQSVFSAATADCALNGGVLSFYRDAVAVFWNPSWLNQDVKKDGIWDCEVIIEVGTLKSYGKECLVYFNGMSTS